jgi:acyl carrier protein
MELANTLKAEVKDLLVTNLMLRMTPEQIGDDLPLFGPGGLGLDSVDALQLVVALDKNYGLKIADPASAREILRSVETIALALAKQRDAPPGGEARGAEAVTS